MSVTYRVTWPGKRRNEIITILLAIAFGIAIGLGLAGYREPPLPVFRIGANR